MVVLVAFCLVLAAAASFAAGIAMSRTSDTLVYLSIAFSVCAFVVLAIASVRSRSAGPRAQPDDFATARLRALEADEDADEVLADEVVAEEGIETAESELAPSWKQDARRSWRSSVPADDRDLDGTEDEADEHDGADDLDDLEEAFRLDPLEVDEGAFEELEEEGEIVPDPEPEAAVGPHGDPLEHDVLDVLEPDPAVDEELLYPIEDYDDLTAAEIVPLLASLALDELEWVWRRESTGGERTTVLTKVEHLIVQRGGTVPTPKKSSAGRAPAKKSRRRTSKRA
jgi:hypothetical protein